MVGGIEEKTMFTGIIQETGSVKSVEKKGTSGRITIEAVECARRVSTGDSIAVDGACLTVTEVRNGFFIADVSSETLSLTTLGDLGPGDRVNLETALTLSTPLGGHIVTGHVDGTGKVEAARASGDFVEIEFSAPSALMRQMVKKGSVAVDGISLTIAGLTGGGFRVAVIPHTLKLTTLAEKGPGASVNIETDILAKYVERLLGRDPGGRITEGFLAEHGFLGGGRRGEGG